MKVGESWEGGGPSDPGCVLTSQGPAWQAQQAAKAGGGTSARSHTWTPGLPGAHYRACKAHSGAKPRPPVIMPFLLQDQVHRHRFSGHLRAASTSLSKQLLHNRFHTPPIESSNRGLLLTRSQSKHSLFQGPSKHQDASAIIKGKQGKEAVLRPQAPSSCTEQRGHRGQTHREQAGACGSQEPRWFFFICLAAYFTRKLGSLF